MSIITKNELTTSSFQLANAHLHVTPQQALTLIQENALFAVATETLGETIMLRETLEGSFSDGRTDRIAKMRIELKNIKHFESMSEETLCFNASLYVDGRKVGAVSNRGHGGCHEYGFDMKTQQELNRWCEENLPKWSMDDDQEYETDLELHISNLVAHFLDTKYIKKLLKKNIENGIVPKEEEAERTANIEEAMEESLKLCKRRE